MGKTKKMRFAVAAGGQRTPSLRTSAIPQRAHLLRQDVL